MRRILLTAAVLSLLAVPVTAPVATAASPPAVPPDLTSVEVNFRGDGGLLMRGTILTKPGKTTGEPAAGAGLTGATSGA
ncbi:hypothetical protein ACFQ08_09475, partial [Streptosporangium algeriense]